MFKLSELLTFLYNHQWIEQKPTVVRDAEINRFTSLKHPTVDALCWAQEPLEPDKIPNCVVLICSLKQEARENCKTVLVHVSDPRNIFREIVSHFNSEIPKVGISNSAIIDDTATIGKNVYIGHGCVIGKNCKIGDNTVIDANVVFYKGVHVGKNCHISSGAVLGADGHGYTKDNNGYYQKIRHMGGVTIGDNVDIGANSCIDRGVLDDTTVGDNTKIDNFVHVAHNVVIGKNCYVIGRVSIGGSCVIGDNVWLGTGAILSNGLTIANNACIRLGAVVIDNVQEGKSVSGNFAIPHEKHLMADAKDKLAR